MKKTPTPFDRIKRTVWVTDSRKAFVVSSNRRCASSKKKTSFGFSRSPTSGSASNSSARSHMSAGREEPRLVLHGRQLEAGDHAASIGCGSQQVVDVELWLTEELVAAAVLQPGERSQQDPDRLRGDTADAGELRLAGIRIEEGQERSQRRKDRGAGDPSCRRSGRRARGSAPACRSIRGPSPGVVARSRTRSRGSERPARFPRARGTRPETPSARTSRRARLPACRRGRIRHPARRFRRGRPSHLRQRPERPARRAAPRAAATCASCPCLSHRRSVHACSRCGAGRRTSASVTTLPSRTPLPTSIDAPVVAYAAAISFPKSLTSRGA